MSDHPDHHAHAKGPVLGHDVRFNEDAYPFWKAHFDEEARAAMVKEDLQAGEFVSAELFAIVFTGVILGLVGVIASM
jgi:hypothetical protein